MDRFGSILLNRCEVILWIEGAGVFIYRYCSALALAKICFTSRSLRLFWVFSRSSFGYIPKALCANNFDNTVFLGLWLWLGLTAKMVRVATT